MKFSATATVMLLLLPGCVTIQKFQSQVYALEKFALVSFYGPSEIKLPWSPARDHVASAKNIRKESGRLAFETSKELRHRLEHSLKLQLAAEDRVVEAKAYKAFPSAGDAEDWVAPSGLKVLGMDKQGDAALGELARALKVDAVMVARAKWELEAEETEREDIQRGYTWLDVVVVDSEGKRLVETGHSARSADIRFFREADKGPADIGVGLFGTGREGKQFDAVKESVTSAMDSFVSAWMEKAPK